MHSAALETRERRLGRYRLFGEIAAGGMATVHFGRLDVEGGVSRIVAIKCMRKHLADDPQFRAMFLDEAALAGRIRHPNVVSTIDVGSSDDGMFLVMDYVNGESLAGLIRRAGERGEPVPLDVSLRVIIDTLHGLHAAHVATDEAGHPLAIVHRDVSPQNILVAGDGLARVLDFGIAKAAVSSHTTRDGQLKGKFRYMAPEQIREGVVDARADVYSASVVLWELLTGEPLFRGSNDAAVLARALEGVIVAPSKLAFRVPRQLDEVVLRGLAREPDVRFHSALDLAVALEALGSAATAKEVGVWVERVAGETMRWRAEQIRLIEKAGASDGLQVGLRGLPAQASGHMNTRTGNVVADPHAAVVPGGTKETHTVRSDAKWVAIGGAIVGLVLAVALVRLRAIGSVSPAASSGEVVVSAPSSSAEVAPFGSTGVLAGEGLPSEPPPVTPSSETIAPVPAVSSPRAGSGPPHRQRSKGSAPGAGRNCATPYYEDPSGIRRVKPECL